MLRFGLNLKTVALCAVGLFLFAGVLALVVEVDADDPYKDDKFEPYEEPVPNTKMSAEKLAVKRELERSHINDLAFRVSQQATFRKNMLGRISQHKVTDRTFEHNALLKSVGKINATIMQLQKYLSEATGKGLALSQELKAKVDEAFAVKSVEPPTNKPQQTKTKSPASTSSRTTVSSASSQGSTRSNLPVSLKPPVAPKKNGPLKPGWGAGPGTQRRLPQKKR